jgi:hypothetical protein
MRDAKPDNPLAESTDAPEIAARSLDFMSLRQLVHFLLRHERWADGNYSAILNALANGLLLGIAKKLRSDQSLYMA